ncbi:MAG TPA: response regulator [Candidatus Nitrosocosmicus sp.]|nr:response regulator [Candidatus Nitrosocosmicus sp.]
MTKSPSVKVVDDEEELANLFRELLKGTVSFTNSILALKHLMEDLQKYSLIITDLGMCGLNEIELAKKIRELSLKVKIVLITVFYSKENSRSHDFEKANISNVIEKPVKLAELRTRVNELCITC